MKKLYYYVLLTTILVGCTHSGIDDVVIGQNGERIRATIESKETKVHLNGELKSVWTEGDKIQVYGNKERAFYRFDGKSGDRNGTFTRYGVWQNIPAFDFGENLYALYIEETVYPSFVCSGTNVDYFYVNIKDSQSYTEGSFDPKSNPMLGTTTDGVNFKFKNLLGYLKLSFTGSKAVRKIKLTGNNGTERLSGAMAAFRIDGSFKDSWGSTAKNEIILDCGESGVQLSSTPKDFYIALVPTGQWASQFTNGITVELTFTDGTTFQKSTTKNIVIARNTIQPMAIVATDGVEWQICSIVYNGGYFSGFEFYGETSVSGTINWGDGIETNVFQGKNHTYLNEATYTITATLSDATMITLTNCKGVSSIDLSEF